MYASMVRQQWPLGEKMFASVLGDKRKLNMVNYGEEFDDYSIKRII